MRKSRANTRGTVEILPKVKKIPKLKKADLFNRNIQEQSP
jgi:hypothetical protein